MLRSRGFTIVELLIVIVVIGVLASVVIVSFTGVSARANTALAQSNANIVRDVAEVYHTQQGRYPDEISTFINNQYASLPDGITILTGSNTLNASNGATSVLWKYDGVPGASTGGTIEYWDFVNNSVSLDVIYIGTGLGENQPGGATLLVSHGTYTGTGGATGASRSITGIGFIPKVIFVWSASLPNASPNFTIDTTLTGIGSNIGYMGENGWNTSTNSDRFVSFDADGFTVQNGSQVAEHYLNSSGVTYYYLALSGDDCYTGSYAGNSTDNRNITGVGFQPIWVFLMGGSAHQAQKFDSSGASTDTTAFTYNAANVSNGIQALQSDGFQVGTVANPSVNASGTTYYYFAIKSGPDTYQSRYTGNASDNRAITGVGFEPTVIFIKSTAARNWAWRSIDMSGDLSKYYRSSGFAANYIQSIDVDGFTIGNAADINTNSDTLDFIVFK